MLPELSSTGTGSQVICARYTLPSSSSSPGDGAVPEKDFSEQSKPSRWCLFPKSRIFCHLRQADGRGEKQCLGLPTELKGIPGGQAGRHGWEQENRESKASNRACKAQRAKIGAWENTKLGLQPPSGENSAKPKKKKSLNNLFS